MRPAEILFAIVSGLAINEFCDVSPWLAGRLVRWSAHRRYRDPARADLRAEELAALVAQRPGQLFKLMTALAFTVTALTAPRVARRPAGVVDVVASVATAAVVSWPEIWDPNGAVRMVAPVVAVLVVVLLPTRAVSLPVAGVLGAALLWLSLPGAPRWGLLVAVAVGVPVGILLVGALHARLGFGATMALAVVLGPAGAIASWTIPLSSVVSLAGDGLLVGLVVGVAAGVGIVPGGAAGRGLRNPIALGIASVRARRSAPP